MAHGSRPAPPGSQYYSCVQTTRKASRSLAFPRSGSKCTAMSTLAVSALVMLCLVALHEEGLAHPTRRPPPHHQLPVATAAATALLLGGLTQQLPPAIIHTNGMEVTQQVMPSIQANIEALSKKSLAAPPLVDFAPPAGPMWAYTDFLKAVKAHQIEKVTLMQGESKLHLTTRSGQKATVHLPSNAQLGDLLMDNGVDVFVAFPSKLRVSWVLWPLLVVTSFLLVCEAFMHRRLMRFVKKGVEDPEPLKLLKLPKMKILSGLKKALSSHDPFDNCKGRFKEITNTGVTFADIAGADGAKLELQEMVDFLKNAPKYTRLGARLPKGALLVGSPGTGKTLLAKAVAGEAGVPFFLVSASEFIELYVGVGAARVRDLFANAKAKAPCIVFIDELDAVGRSRGAGYGTGNDEREQTINQMLSEMDGFESNAGVVVLAATNRVDVLDTALLRPGRFDRQITISCPDLEGRTAILMIHAKGKPLAPAVDLSEVARRCAGFTGADLANLLNEAAIAAARRSSAEGIAMEDIVRALESLQVGPEKAGMLISDAKKKLIAYHEAGHALVGSLIPGYNRITKVSIVPRGGAGGVTHFTPEEDQLESGLYSRRFLEDQLAVSLGGRVAEEIVFGETGTTTGACGDLEKVARTARLMVTQLGFCDEIGQVALTQDSGPAFLGQQVGHTSFMSQETAAIVDEEVKRLVERAYRRAKDLLSQNLGCLHAVAERLLQEEVVDGAAVREIIAAHGSVPYTAEDAPHVALPFQSV